MNGQQLQLDTISNNLANVNTAGFKKSRTQFEDLYYQELRAMGTETADGGPPWQLRHKGCTGIALT